MTEKMQGFLAQLKTFTKDGKQVDSEIVFQPACDWYLEKLNDYLGQRKYPDIGSVIDEFGLDVAEKVIAGEIIAVETDPPQDARKSYCPGPYTLIKTGSKIRYPWPNGTKEYLVRKYFDQ